MKFKNGFLLAGFTVLFLNVLHLASAQVPPVQTTTKFVMANEAYRQGNYPEAISAYEDIVKTGRVSGPLYYNLGNSYLKANQMGKAILNYERALQYIPRDKDLKFNYQYALSWVNAPVAPMNFITNVFKEHVEFYTSGEMVFILTLLIGLLAVFQIVSLFLRWSRRLRLNIMLLMGIFIVIYGIGLGMKIDACQNTAVILKDSESHFEPVENSTVHFKLPQGSKVKILETSEGWVKVERPDDKLGWVPETTLERI